jgi:hypothetical protein
MLTLREIGERTAAARDLKGFWSQVIMGLEYNGTLAQFCLFLSCYLILTRYRVRRTIHAYLFSKP